MKKIAILTVFAALAIAMQVMLFKQSPIRSSATAEGLLAVAGGLRSVVTEAIWFRADRLQREGKFVELAQLASMLSHLEPHEPEVWRYSAWNLAYNICVMMPTEEDRWRWVLSAISLLRDDGLRLNPDAPELYRELAWLFELKFVKNVDYCYKFYTAQWRKIVEDVAKRNAWHEIGMKQEEMKKIEKFYNITDWANPFSSAIYWAHLGLKKSKTRDANALFMEEIVRQCVVMLEKSKPKIQ
jgi:hypothetical protein